MKTKLTDLTEHLFEMMEKLNDDELCENEETKASLIQRANAMAELSDQIINIQNTQLKAIEIADKCGYTLQDLPTNLGITVEKKPTLRIQ